MADIDALKKQLTELTNKVEQMRQDKGIDLDMQLGDVSGSVAALSAKRENCKLRRNLQGHFGKVYALHWGVKDAEFEESPHLITASQDGKLIVWNGMTTNKVFAIPLRSSWVMTCAFEPTKGRMVACGGLDNLCSVYKLTKGNQVVPHATELAHHDGYLSCCRFMNEDNILTSSGDSTCLLWDIEKRQNIVEFSDHLGDVMSLSVCPTDSENIFVSGSCDTTAKVWDKRVTSAAGDKLCSAVMSFGSDTLDEDHAHESDINSVNFMPNGKSFISGSDDSTVRLFDMRACAQVAVYSELRILCGITSVATSKTGRLLFAGYDDHSCWAWDTLRCSQTVKVDERKPYELGGVGKGHDNRVSCVGVNSSGQAVATGSWDTLIKIWG